MRTKQKEITKSVWDNCPFDDEDTDAKGKNSSNLPFQWREVFVSIRDSVDLLPRQIGAGVHSINHILFHPPRIPLEANVLTLNS